MGKKNKKKKKVWKPRTVIPFNTGTRKHKSIKDYKRKKDDNFGDQNLVEL